MEIHPYSILVVVASLLLLTVTGGVGYLTLAEWRDRRRRDEDARTARTAKPRK